MTRKKLRRPPRDIVCWDADVFIAILTNERRSDVELSGLREAVDQADRGQMLVVTAGTIMGEVLGDAGRHLAEVFLRPNFQPPLQMSNELQAEVGRLRTAIKEAGYKMPKHSDATYIATAMRFGARALFTFDDKLLSLDGCPALNGLRIMRPCAEQTTLAI